MSLIVDSSVAVKWIAQEPGSQAARDIIESGDRLIAPEHILFEVANALRKKLAQGIIHRVQATGGVLVAARAFDELVSTRPLLEAALDLAIDLNHPVYDCIYLALAARERVPLLTADQRLIVAARATRIDIRPL